ncbi:MAG: hypothetical protein V4450_15330 [Bacteroidota bacterium]
MKYDSNRLLIVLCVCGMLMGFGCKKNDYLSGGSLHAAVTPLNNMDYLKGNSFKLFDTAAFVIEKLGLATEVNNAKTFFAFTDYSVLNMINLKLQQKQMVNPLATYTLDSLIKDISVDSVRQYILNETVELDGSPELKARPITSTGNTTMGVLKQLQTGAPYVDRTKAPTYLLFYVKVVGALDEPGVTPPVGQNDILVLCQTTGIKTSNGATTLHVLNNNHIFVRF